VRIGGCLVAATIFFGTKLLHVSLPGLFAFNACLVVVWLALAIAGVKDHARLSLAR